MSFFFYTFMIFGTKWPLGSAWVHIIRKKGKDSFDQSCVPYAEGLGIFKFLFQS